MAAIDSLLDGLVDYAGLYPPASLDMDAMVECYATGLAGDCASMMGRIIVPAVALGDFERAAAAILPGHAQDEPWCVSSLVRANEMDADLELIATFNDAHEEPGNGLALIDAIEVKASDPDGIESIASNLPEGLLRLLRFLSMLILADFWRRLPAMALGQRFAQVVCHPSCIQTSKMLRGSSCTRIARRSRLKQRLACTIRCPMTIQTSLLGSWGSSTSLPLRRWRRLLS